jgi:LPS sulfotransferase NodH
VGAERPIIVCGCPRSGTTLLQLMLHAHPRIAIPPETRFVLEGYQQRRQFGDLAREDNRRRLADWITNRPRSRFVDLGLDARAVHDGIVAGPGTLGAAMATVFRAYADRFGKVRWGDKRPAYVFNLAVLTRLFPDAQFVHVVRDGRDCVASLKKMPWFHGGVPGAVSAWAQAVDQGRWAARTLGPQTYLELRYEDLVTDPPAELRRLCGFLGEQYHPAMADPARVAGVAVPERKTWHSRLHQPVDTGRVGSWGRRLEPDEIALCEAALGSRLVDRGYELSGADRPALADRLRYERVHGRHRLAPLRRTLTRATDRMPFSGSLGY